MFLQITQSRWLSGGAQPPIENDLVALYKETLLNAFNSLGSIGGSRARSVEGETDDSDSAGC